MYVQIKDDPSNDIMKNNVPQSSNYHHIGSDRMSYHNKLMNERLTLNSNGVANVNVSPINVSNRMIPLPSYGAATALYDDRNDPSPWTCNVKREVMDELDFSTAICGNTNANHGNGLTPPPMSLFGTRIKQEPDTNHYTCPNSVINNPVITATICNTMNNNTNGGIYSLAQIQNLALKECAKEIDVACETLGISADPFNWSITDVRSWLLWTKRQFNLSPFPLEYFAMDGMTLCSLAETDFKQRAPHCGEILYAQLEIWKTAVELRPEESIFDLNSMLSSWSSLPSPADSCSSSSPMVIPMMDNMTIDMTSDDHVTSGMSLPLSPVSPVASSPKMGLSPGPCISSSGGIVTSDYGSEGARSDDEISDDGCELSGSTGNGGQTTASGSPATGGTGSGRSGSGSHIHLWQFLKELLSQPQLYGSCIRWLDRPKGIFKIEDSVRVARLWGKRKNRPAMNYDKLSRSIRQYYKKGIMKKTERSQRLVYQFCHPYCL